MKDLHHEIINRTEVHHWWYRVRSNLYYLRGGGRVLVLDVLEHIENDVKAIHEMYRIVKSDGLVVIFVPTFMFLWGITDIQSEHYRRYTLKDLRRKLIKGGVQKDKSSPL